MTVKKTLMGIGAISIFSFIGYKLYKVFKAKVDDDAFGIDDFDEEETDWGSYGDIEDDDIFTSEENQDFNSYMNEPVESKDDFDDKKFKMVCGCTRAEAINKLMSDYKDADYSIQDLLTMTNDELSNLYASHITL